MTHKPIRIPPAPSAYVKGGGGFLWQTGYRDFIRVSITRSYCRSSAWLAGWVAALEDTREVVSTACMSGEISLPETTLVEGILGKYKFDTLRNLREIEGVPRGARRYK